MPITGTSITITATFNSIHVSNADTITFALSGVDAANYRIHTQSVAGFAYTGTYTGRINSGVKFYSDSFLLNEAGTLSSEKAATYVDAATCSFTGDGTDGTSGVTYYVANESCYFRLDLTDSIDNTAGGTITAR
jgi:adhesin HecA-like repeat protein